MGRRDRHRRRSRGRGGEAVEGAARQRRRAVAAAAHPAPLRRPARRSKHLQRTLGTCRCLRRWEEKLREGVRAVADVRNASGTKLAPPLRIRQTRALTFPREERRPWMPEAVGTAFCLGSNSRRADRHISWSS
eukprot:gene7257-biopygen13537